MKLPFKIKKFFCPGKKVITKLPWLIAKKSFLIFCLLFLLIILIDGIIYYRYLWKVDVDEIDIEVEKILINEKNYSEFLDNYSTRSKAFSKKSLDFHNIFFR